MRRIVLGTLVIICLLALLLILLEPRPESAPLPEKLPAAAAVASSATSSGAVQRSVATSSTSSSPAQKAQKPAAPAKTAPIEEPATSTANADLASRIENPYSTPALPFSEVNTSARAAIVNILCQQRSGSLQPISGSGVIIDPRGVILTNAHVAQYVLLSETPAVDLSCYIRTGAPAKSSWVASVLYIPRVWVDAHASEINQEHVAGTGEHDYALLYITGTVDGSPLPAQFPYLSPDAREGIAFAGDQELVASYPAEFAGGISTEYGLYPASSVTTVGNLLTFNANTIDLISLGGVIEAQSGSSGGAVVNAWNRLVAIITTTSEGATTGSRDLRAITLSYIDRDLVAQTGRGLSDMLLGDLSAKTSKFTTSVAPGLIDQFISYLEQ